MTAPMALALNAPGPPNPDGILWVMGALGVAFVLVGTGHALLSTAVMCGALLYARKL
jgi:hypothetical protein